MMITHSDVKYLNEKYMKKKANKQINFHVYLQIIKVSMDFMSCLKSILITQTFIIF